MSGLMTNRRRAYRCRSNTCRQWWRKERGQPACTELDTAPVRSSAFRRSGGGIRPNRVNAELQTKWHVCVEAVSCDRSVSTATLGFELRAGDAISPRMANSNKETVLQLDLPGVKKLKSGKVREVFDLGDRLLFVATDRLSAFDVIMPNGMPRKGEVLTQISYFWFAQTESFQPNHLLSRTGDPLPKNLQPFAEKIARRSMIVKKAKPLAIVCVVRGYLAGSGWKEYQKSQTVCGIKLPPGLKESSELPEPIFTPATKAETGHDENISFAEAAKIVGDRSEERRVGKAGR